SSAAARGTACRTRDRPRPTPPGSAAEAAEERGGFFQADETGCREIDEHADGDRDEGFHGEDRGAGAGDGLGEAPREPNGGGHDGGGGHDLEEGDEEIARQES